MRRRTAAVALAIGLLVAGTMGDRPSRAAPAAMSFVNHSTRHTAGEPTFGVLADGTLVYQAFTRTLRSFDGGRNWSVVHETPLTELTLDPYVHVDLPSNAMVVSQLYGACQMVSTSQDGGRIWTDAPSQCPPIDHQKIGSGPVPEGSPYAGAAERLFFTCFNHVADTACAVSLDLGLTWLPLVPVFAGVDPTAEEGIEVPGLCGGLLGDPTSGPDGTIFVPREYCGRPFVGISRDGGITWERVQVADAKVRPIAFGANNPAVAVGADGTVYYAWTGDDWRHHMARSTDGGRTWTDLGAVSPPDIRSTTFPLIIAGDRGRVATAYVGTRHTDLGPDEAVAHAHWHLHVTYSLSGVAASPRWTTVQVTPRGDPVMIGCIARHGLECTTPGHDVLLDFNDIGLMPDGRLAIAYVDGCVKPWCTNGETSQSSLGLLAIQDLGPVLVRPKPKAPIPAPTFTPSPAG